MACVIDKTLSNSLKLKKMKEEGVLQLRKFTWEKCAKETEVIYNKLL